MFRHLHLQHTGQARNLVGPTVFLAPEHKVVLSTDVDEARGDFAAALTDRRDAGAASLGHIRYRRYMNRFSDMLAEQGEDQEAARVQDQLHDTLADRNVLDRVLEEIKDRRQSYLES